MYGWAAKVGDVGWCGIRPGNVFEKIPTEEIDFSLNLPFAEIVLAVTIVDEGI